MGYILLEGGAEFGGQMAEPDLQAIDLAGGCNARISIIPAAAAPDNNHARAGKNGVVWFESLGARNVAWLPLTDRDSADDPSVVKSLTDSQLIYLLGGFPHHLAQSLENTASWQAIQEAGEKSAVIAGSSAGAMVLCSHYYDPQADRVHPGLGLLPRACVLPHHDTFGHRWAPPLLNQLPGATLIGIDEETGLLGVQDVDAWKVYGKGAVTLYKNRDVRRFSAGVDLKLAG